MVGWESVGKAMVGSVYDHICVRVYVFKVMLEREGRYPIYATGHGTSIEVIKTVGCDAK